MTLSKENTYTNADINSFQYGDDPTIFGFTINKNKRTSTNSTSPDLKTLENDEVVIIGGDIYLSESTSGEGKAPRKEALRTLGLPSVDQTWSSAMNATGGPEVSDKEALYIHNIFKNDQYLFVPQGVDQVIYEISTLQNLLKSAN